MSIEEYRTARLAAIRQRPTAGMSAAERADLAERRGEEPKDARDMSPSEYAKALARAIRGSY